MGNARADGARLVSPIRILLCACAVLIATFAFPTEARAATFAVNDTSDAVDDSLADGLCKTATDTCTLRAAIQQANDTTAKDTITLKKATYPLSIPGINENVSATGDLDVNEDLEIRAPKGKRATIDAGDIDAVLEVPGADTELSLKRITIQNGQEEFSGAGIYNNGALDLDSVIVQNNDTVGGGVGGGAGIYSTGPLEMTGGALLFNTGDGPGGGLMMDEADATLTNVLVRRNSGQYGGGVYSVGLSGDRSELTITNSTFANNKANTGYGGALYGQQAKVTVKGLNFSSNFGEDCCGGALANESGRTTVTGSTFRGNRAVGNGGALYNEEGTLIVRSSSVLNNVVEGGDFGGGISNWKGTTELENVVVKGNTAEEGSCCGGGISNEGGTVTVVDSRVSDNVTAGGWGGGIYNESLGLDIAEMTIEGSVIDGNKVAGTGLGGGILNSNAQLEIDRSRITNNSVRDGDGYGGGIYSESTTGDAGDSTLELVRSLVKGNWTLYCCGGGVANYKGTAIIDRSTIDSNWVEKCCGGGLENEGGMMTVKSSTISNNDAFGILEPYEGGGGIWNGGTGVFSSSLIVENSTITGNSSHDGGGAIMAGYLPGDETNLFHVTITGNKAGESTGGLLLYMGDATVKGSIIANSSGPDCNGAITTQGRNVIEKAGNCSFNGPGDSKNKDPKLAALASNGGPTKTHALTNGSPALGRAQGCPNKN